MDFLWNNVTNNAMSFVIVFARLLAITISAPVLGDQTITPPIRLGFTTITTLILLPLVQDHLIPIQTPFELVTQLSISIAIGFFIGTTTKIIFMIVDFVSLHISNFSGLSSATLLNPALNQHTNIFSTFLTMVAVVILINSHYLWILIDGMIKSFKIFGSIQSLEKHNILAQIMQTMTEVFNMSFRLAVPFIIIGMLIQVALGILNRLLPQLQILFLGIPLQTAMTFFLLWMLGPKILNVLADFYTHQLDKLL